MERGGKSATGGATPLWLRRFARATHPSQSGVAGRSLALCRRTPHAAVDGRDSPRNRRVCQVRRTRSTGEPQ